MFNNAELMEETDKLKRFAYRLTQNMADAEDLLHSTIVRALEKKNLYTAGTNLFSWTSKIMFNLFVSGYRRKVKFETQYDPESFIELESVEASQDVQMELREVEQAMKNLSHDHQEILVLVCIKGMQYADVSETLHIPVGTVRSRLSRAREALDNELKAGSIKTIQVPPIHSGQSASRAVA